MTYDRAKQLQLDLIALRAQEDRLVTEAVLRRDWDDAASKAIRAARVDDAITRMLTTGRPYPLPAPADEPPAGVGDAAGGP